MQVIGINMAAMSFLFLSCMFEQFFLELFKSRYYSLRIFDRYVFRSDKYLFSVDINSSRDLFILFTSL